MKKFLLLFLTVSIIFFMASCNKDNFNFDGEFTEKVTTVEIQPHEVVKFTQEPLKILHLFSVNFGTHSSKQDNMFINYMTLSELCEKKLGFTLDFIEIPSHLEEYNGYLSYLDSGLSGDLIFPTKASGITHTTKYNTWAASFYWNDKWIEEGIYMDITKYIPQFCPQAILNFEKYPEIKQMCSRNGRIYAVYAGMPTVTALSIIIKDSILEENNIESVTDFSTLLDIMDSKYKGNESIPETQKILISHWDLLLYSMIKAGYYPTYNSNIGIVLDMDDQNFSPLAIEDTDILDRLHEEFSPFFAGNYFTDDMDQNSALIRGEQDFYITHSPLWTIKSFAMQCIDEKNNIFNKGYSIFLMDAPCIYSEPYDIQPIPIPHSSTQPEKALYFMQWLMTDPDVADILTYGSRIMNLGHYRFSSDDVIIPEANNTIYGFYNLIANFSKKAFLCGNTQFNIAEQYREKTYEALYPPFYKALGSDHMNFNLISAYRQSVVFQYNDRRSFLANSIHEWITNPYSTLTVHDVEKVLLEFPDNEEMMKFITEYIESIDISVGGVS